MTWCSAFYRTFGPLLAPYSIESGLAKCGLGGALQEHILGTAQVIDIEALARFPKWRTVPRARDGKHRLKNGNK